MRACKIDNIYYQIELVDNQFYINWATIKGLRKGHFCTENGIDINKKDWINFNLANKIKDIYLKYELEHDKMRAISKRFKINNFNFIDRIDKRIEFKKHLAIKDLLKNINWTK